jgi:general secretion pathway protein I
MSSKPWRRVPGARRAAGFTLIEVVVALAIVVLGMTAVLGALSSSASTVMYLRDKTFAQWVGLNQVATTRLTAQSQNQPPQTGDSSGDVDFAGRKWHWRQVVSVNELVPGVVRIDVSVRPSDAKGDDTHGWYTTVSGAYGEALGLARGDMPAWGTGTTATQMQGAPGTATDSFFSSSSSSSAAGAAQDGSSSAASSSSDSFFSSSSSASSSSSRMFQ